MRIERVLAPNPGPYTGPGTNTYVISAAGEAVVLDPGPLIDRHLASIEAALAPVTPTAVLVTHTHPDHAPAANPLGDRLGVPVLGFAPGPAFEPTATLADGDVFAIGDVTLVAVHTPGHTPDHLCYRLDDVVFTGDHVMGGSTVIIDDAAAYLDSLRKVLALDPRRLYPGHGDEIGDAAAVLTDYLRHRQERERQVMAAIVGGAETVAAIVDVVYTPLAESLRPAAEYQVRTQLQKLVSEGRVTWRRGPAETITSSSAAEEPE